MQESVKFGVAGIVTEAVEQRDRELGTAAAESKLSAAELEEQRRFWVLIAAILSARTRDVVTNEAFQALLKHGLSIDGILSLSEEQIEAMIARVHYCHKKSKFVHALVRRLRRVLIAACDAAARCRFLRETCQQLRSKHGDKVPSRSKDLLGTLTLASAMLNQCAFLCRASWRRAKVGSLRAAALSLLTRVACLPQPRQAHRDSRVRKVLYAERFP